MPASSVMGHYSPNSPREMSPETMSPIYPERPIRPLPKRRLRERLSSDVAESIKYPPAPPTTTPLFYYPYNVNGTEDATRGGLYPVDRQRADEIERNYISRRNGEEVESDEEFPEYPNRGRYSRHSPDTSGRSYRYVQKPESSKYSKPEPPASTTSSADGYDSFENTNNKKKRKIPTPGDASLNGIHLSNDLASLGISSPGEEALFREDLGNSPGQNYASGAPAGSGSLVSNSGRVRLGSGRRSGRSPLRTLSDAPNHWPNGRGPKQRQPQWTGNETNGIISSAIANAEKLPVTPAKGQENTSLLQQQAIKKSSPASAQFTFTCDSQVPGTVTWPGPNSTVNESQQNPVVRTTATHATQTSPKAAMPVVGQRMSRTDSTQGGTNAEPTKPRRRRTAAKEYRLAARQRREQQQNENYLHPPDAKNQWICEFCEYEQIFGTQPEALIRQYEVKDRRIRKQKAEQQRLLEKAKAKGRKGKKGSKTGSKNAAAAHDRHAHQNQPQRQTSTGQHHSQSQSQGTQSEEYYDDDYDEEYEPDEDPPMSPEIPAPALAKQEEVQAYRKHLATADPPDGAKA